MCRLRRIGRKITGTLRHCWNAGIFRDSTNFVVPLLAPEDEQFVLDDRTTDRVAPVIAGDAVAAFVRKASACRVSNRRALRREIRAGIQHSVASAVQNAAMPVVASTPGDDIDHRAGSLAILRAIAVAQHLEFGDRFDRGIDQNRAVRTHVVVVGAVNQVEVAGGSVSVYGEVNAALQTFVLAVEVVRGGYARRQLRQLNEATSIQRQFANLLPFHGFTEGGIVRLHLDGIRFYVHMFGRAADLQLNIGCGRSSCVHFHVVGDRLFKIRSLHHQLVAARRQGFKSVIAGGICIHCARSAGRRIRDSHWDACCYCPCLICHCSGDDARCHLSVCR